MPETADSNASLRVQIREYLASIADESGEFVSERDIAKRFNLNRSNSRKLLMTLEGEGLLQCIPQKGYRLIDYSRTQNRTLYKVRASVESEAARLAADRASREDILRMMLILEDAGTAMNNGDLNRFATLDDEFHRALVNASHDKMLIKMFSFLFVQNLRKTPYPAGGMEKTHREHAAVMDGVRGHNPEAARQAVLEHLSAFVVEENGRVETMVRSETPDEAIERPRN